MFPKIAGVNNGKSLVGFERMNRWNGQIIEGGLNWGEGEND